MNKSITQKLSVTEKETDGKIYKEFPCSPEYTVWWGEIWFIHLRGPEEKRPRVYRVVIEMKVIGESRLYLFGNRYPERGGMNSLL